MKASAVNGEAIPVARRRRSSKSKVMVHAGGREMPMEEAMRSDSLYALSRRWFYDGHSRPEVGKRPLPRRPPPKLPPPMKHTQSTLMRMGPEKKAVDVKKIEEVILGSGESAESVHDKEEMIKRWKQLRGWHVNQYRHRLHRHKHRLLLLDPRKDSPNNI